MSDTMVIPGAVTVRNLLEDLLGREVSVNPGSPMTADDLPCAVVGVFTDSAQSLVAVLGMQLSLAANAGAALGLMPAGAAEAALEDKALSPTLAENVGELFNVFTSLLNREGAPHVKLSQVVYPGAPLPNDVRAHLLALGRRLDLTVEVNRYGKGTLSLSLAP